MARIALTAESAREEWDGVIGINLRGVWICMKYGLQQMERRGSDAIVNQRIWRSVDAQLWYGLLHASAVLWLCSPGSGYGVGHALTVDGGMTVL